MLIPGFSEDEDNLATSVILPKFEGYIKMENLQMNAKDFSTLVPSQMLEDSVSYNVFLFRIPQNQRVCRSQARHRNT